MSDGAAFDSVEEMIGAGWDARRAGHSEEARRLLGEALAHCRTMGAGEALIRVCGMLGHVEMDAGHWAQARGLYEEAAGLARELGKMPAVAHALRHLGDVHRHTKDFEAAESCYQEAIQIDRGNEAGVRIGLANALRAMALLKEQTGHCEEAVSLWTEARDLYLAENVPEGARECSDHLPQLKGPCRDK